MSAITKIIKYPRQSQQKDKKNIIAIIAKIAKIAQRLRHFNDTVSALWCDYNLLNPEYECRRNAPGQAFH